MTKTPFELSGLSAQEKRRLLESLLKKQAADHFLPLSYSQRAMWFLYQLAPSSSAYNTAFAARVRSNIDVSALKQAFQAMMQRHATLRTTFAVREGQPIQHIHAFLEPDFLQIDGSEWSEEALRTRVEVAHAQPFDLEKGPMLRVRLFTRSVSDHLLLLTVHHIVFDAWSFWVLLDELRVLYDAEKRGGTRALPALSADYSNFVEWESQMVAGADGQKHWSYWQAQLDGELPFLDLPTDRPRPPVQTYQGAALSFGLGEDLTIRLKTLATNEASTVFMTLLSAYYILLYRFTGQKDILVGSPTTGRSRAEYSGIIGDFVNMVVLRAQLDGTGSFRELLHQVRQTVLDALAHQEFPFPLIVEKLGLARDSSRSPVFQSVFVFHKAQRSGDLEALFDSAKAGLRARLGELELEPYSLEQQTGQFDLTLEMTETSSQLVGNLKYNTDLFDRPTIERMAGHFRTLLESIVSHADLAIDQLPILATEQYQELLIGGQAVTSFAPDRCLHEMFELQAERSPESVAVVCEGESLTYGELNRRANQVSHHLVRLGVKPGEHVGLCLERTLSLMVGLLGILKAGAAYVPLDPVYPADRKAYMLEDAGARILITESSLALNGGEAESVSFVYLDKVWETIANEVDTNLGRQVTPDSTAYVIYTSGTTGRPKGVPISHSNVVRLFEATQAWYHFDERDCWTLFHSVAFDFSVWEIWGALLYGARLVLVPYWVSRSPATFYQLLCRERVSVLNQTPSAFRQLIEAEEEVGPSTDLSLRLVIFGGEALELQSLSPWFERHGDQCPQIVNMYGITETTVHVTYRPILQKDLQGVPRSLIGKAIPDLDLYILDSHMQLVPVGVPGEICVGGAGLSRGYLNRPELTNERFVPNKFSSDPVARLYRSGDMARLLPDGDIEYLGRIDQQVKIRGFRIELGEIESVLRQHPKVRESLVLMKDGGISGKQLVAYVLHHQNTVPTSAELRQFLKEKLPDYMIPSAFVSLERFPLTTNGKIDRRALPDPGGTRSALESAYVAPKTEVEKTITAVWQELLGLDRIGIYDNFFELGGHSLLATQVISRLQKRFGVQFTLHSFFAAPTIESIATAVDSALRKGKKDQAQPIGTVSRGQDLPLSYAQERVWFMDQFEPDSAFYNIPAALRLKGPLQFSLLERSLQGIIQRHEALRTTFDQVQGIATQRIAARLDLTLPLIDLGALPESDRMSQLQKIATEEAQRPFILSRGPLVRATLVRLGAEEHVLLLTMQHIVSDAWSMGLFLKELASLYEANASGTPALLSPLSLQYADFAIWQRQWLEGGVLEEQAAYWKQQLVGAPAFVELPTDRPRPAIQTFKGALYSWILPKSLLKSLEVLSRREQVTLFMTLMAAFQVLLARYTGQEDIIVGSPIANRNHAEIEELIGFFVNTLVLRTNLTGNPSFQQVLAQLSQSALGAYEHQDLPFEKLVEIMQPQRDRSHSPLFQVMLALQNAPLPSLQLAGLNFDFLPLHSGTSKFDLTLYMAETEEGLRADWEYNTDLFDAATIARMAGHFQTLLEGIVMQPAARVSELPLLPASEREHLLKGLNATGVEYPERSCVHELLEEQARRAPKSIAVVLGEEEMSYGELNARANQIAHYLRQQGVGPEVLVALCVERSVEMLVCLLGILKAGGAYVPLDPQYPPERLGFMLEDSGAAVVVTEQAFLERFEAEGVRTVCLERDRESIAGASRENPDNRTTAKNLAYVIYTSGSTGKPKGVMIPHGAVVNFLMSMQREPGIEAKDVLLAVTTLSFDIAGLELYLPLVAGARVVLLKREQAADGRVLAEMIEKMGATIMQATPTTWQILLASGWEGDRRLKILCGGEPLPLDLARQLLPCCGQLWNLYGPTETTIWSTISRITEGEERITIGRPIGNTEIYILDSQLQPVPIGVHGELFIGGAGLARGYLNRVELTAERFIPHPFRSEGVARLYKTGDRARYLADGRIEHLGRLDFQIKLRGFRIELGEVESVLRQCRSVRNAVVMVREDVPGDSQLVAYLVAGPEGEISAVQLRQQLRDQLPEYMIPSAFVFLSELPLTPNGKIDRKALPAPEGRRHCEESFVAPRDQNEQRLAAIWQELLRIPQIGIHDSFFELGGNSLKAIEAVYRIQKAFDTKLSLVTFFDNQTISSLADTIARHKAAVVQREDQFAEQQSGLALGDMLSMNPKDRHVPFPLTDVQEAYWIGRRSGIEMGNVGTHAYWEIDINNLDFARFEKAWQRLVNQHEMLRAIVLPDGQQQILEKTPPFRIETRDLADMSTSAAQGILAAVREEMSHQVLPSDHWPIFEIRAFRLHEKRYRLFFSFDLLIGDAWSFQILQRDFNIFYNDPDINLPPLDLSFRDYVLAESKFRESGTYRKSLIYWEERAKVLPLGPELPLAKAPEGVIKPRFKRRESKLDSHLWGKLKRKAKVYGLTENGVLMTAYADVLGTWSKRAHFLLNLTLFNRLPIHPQVMDIIGDFTSITLLEVNLSGSETFLDLARKLLGQLWQDLDHRFVSGVQVLRKLATYQADRRTVLAPVIFTSTLGFEPKDQNSDSFAAQSELVYSITQTPQVWMDHMVTTRNGELIFCWDVVEELFPSGMIDDMFHAYCLHLKSLAEEESAWLEPRSERVAKLIPEWQHEQRRSANSTSMPPSDDLLHQLFEKQAHQSPDNLAVVSKQIRLTYKELQQLSRALGRTLRAQGAKPNSLVAVVMEKGWEQVVAVLGILQSGAAYVPIEAALPQERRFQLLKNAEVKWIVTQPELDQTLEWPNDVQRLCVQLGEETDIPSLETVQGPNDLAYVIYTSGSTGLPKGVMIDHRGAVNTINDMNQRFQVGPQDRVLALSSLSFDLSVYDVFGILAAGGAIVFPEPEALRDPSRWAELMQKECVTVWNSVPALMEMLTVYVEGKGKKLPLSLRLVLMSGDWIPVTLPDQIKAVSNGVQIISLGGATEASIWSILFPIEDVDPTWKSIPYGHPMVNQSFEVFNEALDPSPVWVPGQLYIGGIGLAKGYWNDVKKTDEKFIIHPQTRERLYCTGDLGRYLPCGEIEFLGREDFQVKIRGFRIELGEIEAALRQHPAVRSAVVIARGDTTSERRLIAYVVPHQDGQANAKTQDGDNGLRTFLGEKLPEYMIPSGIVFLESLPLSPNGKVDCRSLPEPGEPERHTRVAHLPPQNPIQEVMAKIWEEVLHITEVGIHDSFFELGGDSIKAIQLISRLSKAGFPFTATQVFLHPTIEELSRIASSANDQGGEKNRVEPTDPESISVGHPDREEFEL
ncbi:MAG: amino acid adenylation domain-containing protein [Terriglobia bacterium]